MSAFDFPFDAAGPIIQGEPLTRRVISAGAAVMDSHSLINRLAEQLLVDHARKKNQVYLITSAVDGEGCTYVSDFLNDALRAWLPGKVHLIAVPKQERANVAEDSFPDEFRAEFFEELKRQYKVILIDAGGLLKRGRAVPFLGECDACVLVTRAGVTRRGQVKEAIEVLKRYNIPILGSVLNGVRHSIPGFLYKRL
jgi:hypothetical protein